MVRKISQVPLSISILMAGAVNAGTIKAPYSDTAVNKKFGRHKKQAAANNASFPFSKVPLVPEHSPIKIAPINKKGE